VGGELTSAQRCLFVRTKWRAGERTALSFRSDEPFRPDMRTAKLFIVIAKGKRTALLFFGCHFFGQARGAVFFLLRPFFHFV